MKTIAGLILLLMTVSAMTAQETADVIYYNGRVVTMWDARPTAEAVAIRGNRFLKVGSNAEVLHSAGSCQRGARPATREWSGGATPAQCVRSKNDALPYVTRMTFGMTKRKSAFVWFASPDYAGLGMWQVSASLESRVPQKKLHQRLVEERIARHDYQSN